MRNATRIEDREYVLYFYPEADEDAPVRLAGKGNWSDIRFKGSFYGLCRYLEAQDALECPVAPCVAQEIGLELGA